MPYLILPSKRTRQPQGAARINPRFAPARAWIPGIGDVTGYSALGRTADTVAPFGLAYSQSNVINERDQLDTCSWMTTGAFSLVVALQHGVVGNGQGYGVRALGTAATRAALSLDASKYIVDYGGYGEGTNRLTASGVDTTSGRVAFVVMTVGAAGMRIFENGILLASNAASPTRSNTTSDEFACGDLYGGDAGTSKQGLVVPFLYQLPDALASDLSRNPWQIFASSPRRIWFDVGAGGGAFTVDAQPGSFAVTGTDATLARSRLLDAQPGTFTVNGTAATLAKGRILDAQPGTFAVNGTAATLAKNLVLDAQPGTFALSGTAATLEKTTAGAFTIDAQPGIFAVTGTVATLARSRLFDAQPGTFTLSGTDATLTKNAAAAFELDCQPGSFAITGRAATLSYSGASVWTDVSPSTTVWSDVSAASTVWSDL